MPAVLSRALQCFLILPDQRFHARWTYFWCTQWALCTGSLSAWCSWTHRPVPPRDRGDSVETMANLRSNPKTRAPVTPFAERGPRRRVSTGRLTVIKINRKKRSLKTWGRELRMLGFRIRRRWSGELGGAETESKQTHIWIGFGYRFFSGMKKYCQFFQNSETQKVTRSDEKNRRRS